MQFFNKGLTFSYFQKPFKQYIQKYHFSFLCANVPIQKVYVRREFLTQFNKDDKGQYDEGHWITVKSKKDRAFLFETLLSEYGALYDKLPISAFLWKKDVDPQQLLPLNYLQLWNCMSYNISVIKKQTIANCRCDVFMKNGKFYPGTYLFTIDNCQSDPNQADLTWSEIPAEHKSFNIIKLDNGQFCAQPNNRILWQQSSLIPKVRKRPIFKVCDIDYAVEDTPGWSVGDAEEYFYVENSEKKELNRIFKEQHGDLSKDSQKIKEENIKNNEKSDTDAPKLMKQQNNLSEEKQQQKSSLSSQA